MTVLRGVGGVVCLAFDETLCTGFTVVLQVEQTAIDAKVVSF